MAATATQGPLTGLPRRLVQDGVLSEASLGQAIEAIEGRAANLVPYLVSNQLADARQIAVAAAHEFGVPLLDLDALELDLDVVKLVDDKLLTKHRVLPLLQRGKRLYVAVCDPTNLQALDEIKFATTLRVEPIVVEHNKLEARVASSISASMIVRQSQHPDIQGWVERAYSASLKQSDPNLRLHVETRTALGIMWAGHFPRAWQVIQGMQALVAQHEVSPFQLCMLKLTEASYYMLTAQTEACLRTVKEGLENERATGAHVMTHQLLAYGAGGALMTGDVERAQKLLDESAALPAPRGRFDT